MEVWKFGVHLPLSTNFELIGQRGTRHAAALGLAEHSDAFIIAISEERGEVSLAQNGTLTTVSHFSQLRNALRPALHSRRPSTFYKRVLQRGSRTLALASMAFLITTFFWLLIAHRVEQVQRIVDRVPIETLGVPSHWVVESMQPEEVRVKLSGSERAFEAFEWSQLKIQLDFDEFKEGRQSLVLTKTAIELPPEMKVLEIEPNVISVTAYPTRVIQVPVTVRTQGSLPEGTIRNELIPSPRSVAVRIRGGQDSPPRTIPTELIELSESPSKPIADVKLVFPRGVVPVETTPHSVEVRLDPKHSEPRETGDAAKK